MGVVLIVYIFCFALFLVHNIYSNSPKTKTAYLEYLREITPYVKGRNKYVVKKSSQLLLIFR